MRTVEKWRPVIGFENCYEVSSHGRVRSVDRMIIDSLGRAGIRKGKTLRPGRAGSRAAYLMVILVHQDKRTPRLVHRLVLEAFVGECPPGLQGCHYDGDSTNNLLENLRWDTGTNNCADRKRHGRGTGGKGERNRGAKLNSDHVQTIRQRAASGESLANIAADFDVHRNQIRRIIRKERWKHI